MNNILKFEGESPNSSARSDASIFRRGAITPRTPIWRLAFLGYPYHRRALLKNQLQRKLYLPRSPRRMRDNPKSAAPHRIRRQTEIDNVKHIKELRPELHQPQIAL